MLKLLDRVLKKFFIRQRASMKNISKILIVAHYTLKDILKSRILYGTLFIAVALVVVTYVAMEFTYGVPEKVALDFGLGMLSLSSLGISLFMGATLLSSEVDSRTVYMVISRPVPRWCFIIGKIIGLMAVLVMNVTLLGVITLLASSAFGGEVNQVVILSFVFNIFESLLLLLVVIFFSLFTNNILATLISLTVLVLGHAVKETQSILFVQSRPLLGKVLELYHLVLPGFYKLNIKDFVVYERTIESSYILNSLLYGTFYSLFLLFMIIYIFNRKNID